MARSNASGQLLDKYRAKVVSVEHPKGWHMAKIRVLVLWDDVQDINLPWAEYELPLGARPGEGDAMPSKVGDLVWVEFPMAGDSRIPLITGACYTVTDGKSDLPQDLLTALYVHKRTDDEPPGPIVAYGDKVLDLFGILQQITLDGAWCLTHKSTGTALNITKDGNLVLHSEADSYQSTNGALKVTVTGKADISASDIKIHASGPIAIEAGGELSFKGSVITGKTGSIYDFK
jgi:hypothetical protein